MVTLLRFFIQCEDNLYSTLLSILQLGVNSSRGNIWPSVCTKLKDGCSLLNSNNLTSVADVTRLESREGRGFGDDASRASSESSRHATCFQVTDRNHGILKIRSLNDEI